MGDSLTVDQLRDMSDLELIDRLRNCHCEIILGRSGRLSVYIPVELPESTIPTSCIREVFRRRMRLLPYARINGIRLRETGALVAAA